MGRRSWTRLVIGALVALFMVVLLPSCWYGTLRRAAMATDIPANGNEEEREKHEEHEARAVEDDAVPSDERRAGRAPGRAVATRTAYVAPPTSVGPPSHPSRYSVRRLR